jgi:signal transduction histidine kinase
MDLLNGRVTVESDEGHGTTFWASFPVTQTRAGKALSIQHQTRPK